MAEKKSSGKSSNATAKAGLRKVEESRRFRESLGFIGRAVDSASGKADKPEIQMQGTRPPKKGQPKDD